jgi:hypothetical protein
MVDFPFSMFDYQIGIEKRWGWSWGKTPPQTFPIKRHPFPSEHEDWTQWGPI